MLKLILRWVLAILVSMLILLFFLRIGNVWEYYKEYGYIGQFFSSLASYFFASSASVLVGMYISKCSNKSGITFAIIDWVIVIALLLFFQVFISNSTLNMILYFCYFVSSIIGAIVPLVMYRK